MITRNWKIIVILTMGVALLGAIILYQYQEYRVNSEPDDYYFADKYVSEDCNMYLMVFNEKSPYILRVALSGSCRQLKIKDYAREFEILLNQYSSSLSAKKGKILFEHYFDGQGQELLIHKIEEITTKHYHSKVMIKHQVGVGRFEIEIM